MVLVDGALVHLLLLQRNDYSVSKVESLLESSKMLKMITFAVQFSDMLKTSTELQVDYSEVVKRVDTGEHNMMQYY
jgi:hypothetical protein